MIVAFSPPHGPIFETCLRRLAGFGANCFSSFKTLSPALCFAQFRRVRAGDFCRHYVPYGIKIAFLPLASANAISAFQLRTVARLEVGKNGGDRF